MIDTMDHHKSAFTLIELLIVVAIIAILALVAVPNFLEAQARAKVARAMSDLRTLAVAIEAYRVDDVAWPVNPVYPSNNRWRIVRDRGWPMYYGIWYTLTTPVAYLTSLPHEPFTRPFSTDGILWGDHYRLWNLEGHPAEYARSGRVLGHPAGPGGGSTLCLARSGVWVLMASAGPDRVSDIGDGSDGDGFPATGGLMVYDPTNGTVSWGDVYYGLGVQFHVYQKSVQ